MQQHTCALPCAGSASTVYLQLCCWTSVCRTVWCGPCCCNCGWLDARGDAAQVMPGRSHALLQEAGVNLVALMKEEGFYVERRIMSSPEATRGRGSFGEASPIELPTPHELSTYADKCALLLGSPAHGNFLPASPRRWRQEFGLGSKQPPHVEVSPQGITFM